MEKGGQALGWGAQESSGAPSLEVLKRCVDIVLRGFEEAEV